MTETFQWARRADCSLECSSKGDKRFSALYARLEDGRSIEMHYQCDIKAHQPGGVDWRLGKGKPPLDTSKDLWEEYLALWKRWAAINPKTVSELYRLASERNRTLTDCFASSPINQARALSIVLNEYASNQKKNEL